MARRAARKRSTSGPSLAEGLAAGEHTIRVVVTGEKNPRSNNAFVSVDAFLILGSGAEGQVQMNINNAWNYPEITWGNYVKPPIFIARATATRCACARTMISTTDSRSSVYLPRKDTKGKEKAFHPWRPLCLCG